MLGEVVDSLSQLSTVKLNNAIEAHQEEQRKSEKLAGAQYEAGSMQRIQAIMRDMRNEAAQDLGCAPLPSEDGARIQRRGTEEDELCQPLNFQTDYWKFIKTFDGEKFAKQLDQRTKRGLTRQEEKQAKRLRFALEHVVDLQGEGKLGTINSKLTSCR